jgi:hypothetical protein
VPQDSDGATPEEGDAVRGLGVRLRAAKVGERKVERLHRQKLPGAALMILRFGPKVPEIMD